MKEIKIYHVETQADYDALMIELEEKGCKWIDGEKLIVFDEFSTYGIDTYVYDECCKISISSGNYFKEHHSDEPVIEYKAKGESMTQEEKKQNILDWATDVSVAVEAAIKGIKFQMKKSTVEADLQEAKSSAKKLIEKIDEYLEYQKPEFKVGDYVALHAFHKEIAKIDKICGDKLHGLWYDTKSKNIEQDYYLGSGTVVKRATATEILEYEVALTFHKNGRKPFEVERGDIVYLKGYDKNIFLDSGNIYKKHNFINGDVVLVKTVEEVNKWLLKKEKTEK